MFHVETKSEQIKMKWTTMWISNSIVDDSTWVPRGLDGWECSIFFETFRLFGHLNHAIKDMTTSTCHTNITVIQYIYMYQIRDSRELGARGVIGTISCKIRLQPPTEPQRVGFLGTLYKPFGTCWRGSGLYMYICRYVQSSSPHKSHALPPCLCLWHCQPLRSLS